jgi:hypothetical protein
LPGSALPHDQLVSRCCCGGACLLLADDDLVVRLLLRCCEGVFSVLGTNCEVGKLLGKFLGHGFAPLVKVISTQLGHREGYRLYDSDLF